MQNLLRTAAWLRSSGSCIFHASFSPRIIRVIMRLSAIGRVRLLPRRYGVTLLGRCVFLLAGLAAANIVVWVITVLLFAPHKDTRSVLSLALVAWTYGLRHALDMDHIVAIDNATRNLVSIGRLPCTCGLFFSLGHSTVVIVVTVVIIISTRAIARIPDVASVGGVIGVSVSASFLLLLAIVNSFSLYYALKERKRLKTAREAMSEQAVVGGAVEADAEVVGVTLENDGDSFVADESGILKPTKGTDSAELTPVRSSDTHAAPLVRVASSDSQLAPLATASKTNDSQVSIKTSDELERNPVQPVTGDVSSLTCMGRITRPLLKLIDRPWKLYPVGLLFGLGFDTASEVSLLGITALAQTRGANDEQLIPVSRIIVLPLLFTCGMALIDSIDSVFMLHAYAIPSTKDKTQNFEESTEVYDSKQKGLIWWLDDDSTLVSAEEIEESRWPKFRRKWALIKKHNVPGETEQDFECEDATPQDVEEQLYRPEESDLLVISIALTVLSISIAIIISIIEFMSLALEECDKCSDDMENDPGLSGNWWRFWNALSENSGYIGIGIFGLFIVLFVGWAMFRRHLKKKIN